MEGYSMASNLIKGNVYPSSDSTHVLHSLQSQKNNSNFCFLHIVYLATFVTVGWYAIFNSLHLHSCSFNLKHNSVFTTVSSLNLKKEKEKEKQKPSMHSELDVSISVCLKCHQICTQVS